MLVLFLAGPAARAGTPEARAGARLDTYSDEWITVVSPQVRAAAPAGEHLEVEARYQTDALTAATPLVTVDGVTTATRFQEVRHEGSAGVRVHPTQTWSVGGDYTVSDEPDYRTHQIAASGEAELFHRMATVFAGARASFEKVGMATDPTFDEAAQGYTLDLGWAHVLGPRTTLTLLLNGQFYECGARLGCQASPYRFVPIESGPAVPERHPATRTHYAAGLQLAQGAGQDVAIHGGYRLYDDTWGVAGHTADLAIARGLLAERLVLRAETRFTRHGAASFYRAAYEGEASTVPRYRTAKRELAAMWDMVFGMRAEWRTSETGAPVELRVSARAARIWYRYLDVPGQSGREAWLLGAGLDSKF